MLDLPSSQDFSPETGSTGSSDGIMANDVPVSSSPSSSSPAFIFTPPDGHAVPPHDSFPHEEEKDSLTLADLSPVISVPFKFEGINISGSGLCVDHDEIAPAAPTFYQPGKETPGSKNGDSSSGSESWIEDYLTPDSYSHLTGMGQLEFSRQLSALLTQVLEGRGRIQSFLSQESVSPYTQDLLARSIVTPFSQPLLGAIDHPRGSPSPMLSPSAKSSTATPSALDSELVSEKTHILIPSRATLQVSQFSRSGLVSPSSGYAGDDKENRSHETLALHPFSKVAPGHAYSHQIPMRTPSPDTNSIIPSAPRKALHQVRIPRPQNRPPPFPLPRPSLALNAQVFDSDLADVFGPKILHSAIDHGSSSGVKRKTPTVSDLSGLKKRKVTDSMFVSQDITSQDDVGDSDPKEPCRSKFATGRASLRKAASLRSEASLSGTSSVKGSPAHTPLNKAPLPSIDDPSSARPPTQPATPMPSGRRTKLQTLFEDQARSPDLLLSPVPIIAPPPYDEIPRAHLSDVESAEARIAIMLAKEQEERNGDGIKSLIYKNETSLPNSSKCKESLSSDEEDVDMDEEEKQMWRDMDSPTDISDCGSRGLAAADQVKIDCDEEGQNLTHCFPDNASSLEEDFHQDAIEWVLNVLPPGSQSKPTTCEQLRDQLNLSPDTRWHAAHLFTRYFVRTSSSQVGSEPSCLPRGPVEHGKISSKGDRATHVWDVALACLSLTVKFHRDVLSPLFPVLADEFLALAPRDVGYSNFEAAQRDVLAAFSHCIGSVTPGAYIQELWNALSSLRALLHFKGGLEAATRATWEILYDGFFELPYLAFPTSLLTACAFAHGVKYTLILKARVDLAAALQNRTERWRSRRGARCDCEKLQKAARTKVKNVELDIREILGVGKEEWDACYDWVETVLEDD